MGARSTSAFFAKHHQRRLIVRGFAAQRFLHKRLGPPTRRGRYRVAAIEHKHRGELIDPMDDLRARQAEHQQQHQQRAQAQAAPEAQRREPTRREQASATQGAAAAKARGQRGG
ncbi:MAG: hypothetical protein HC828_16055 [Blastochloris sp.]|nr:hypothetical protein [Blastochloris sp.]